MLFGLQLAGLPAVTANTIAVSIAAVLTYPASRRWVWPRTRGTRQRTEVTLFAITTAVGFALSTGLVWLLVSPGASAVTANVVNIGAFGVVWVGKYLVLDGLVFATPRGGARGRQVRQRESPHRPPRRPLWSPRLLYGWQRTTDVWGRALVAGVALLLVPVAAAGALATADVPDDPYTALYPGRPHAAASDIEAVLGAGVTVDGVATTVERGQLIDGLSELERGRYLGVTVAVANHSDAAYRIRRTRWRVHTPAGHVYPAAVTTDSDVAGRAVSPGAVRRGRLLFEVGDESGTFYISHDAPGRSDRRGVWRIVAET